FDAHSLALFKKRLLNCPRYKLKYKPDAKDAAVLVPLCVVNHKPSILFTVRNLNMRVHRGEVSFPGGKTDETDSSTEFTALREAQEEIGVDPTSIDILGRFSTLPNKDGSLKVHPYVGFIKDEVNLTNFNQEEVHDVFTVPVDYLL
ncbi:NUDIX hydrolase domain-like protein, partial [Mycotypha africana]|uniref:NUDIX hydrolase domain-like protein n=1 Tax=Mycotypha africana TaxID=64632 RepID=UPI002301B4FB